MVPHSDFIKFIAYHNVLSPRIRDWYLPRFQKSILGDILACCRARVPGSGGTEVMTMT